MAKILTSWKEIAAYLGKGVRTVQRWEVELDLPVRRPNGSDRQIVMAFAEELESWAKGRRQNSCGPRADQFERARELAAGLAAQIAQLADISQKLAACINRQPPISPLLNNDVVEFLAPRPHEIGNSLSPVVTRSLADE